jgi:hypothetical protein
MANQTRIVGTGAVRERLTTEDYLALVALLDYRQPGSREVVVRQVEAGDPGARFAVYGTALRKGLIERVRAA